MTWWHTASREAKLTQIDAGIELGMTARQVALASGASAYRSGNSAVGIYARCYGRSFPAENTRMGSHMVKKRGALKRAYWNGARDFTDASIRTHEQEDRPELVLE